MATEGGARVPARSEIDARYKWRLEDMFRTDIDWEQERRALARDHKALGAYRGRLAEGAATMRECLALQDGVARRCEALYAYAKMRRDEDNAVDKYQAYTDMAMGLFSEAAAEAAFVAPEILAAGRERVEAFMAEDAELAVYRHFFDDLFRQAAHVLGEREEALLALAAEPLGAASDIYTRFTNADLAFPDVRDEGGEAVELSEGRYVRFMESPDRSVREGAFRALYGTYAKFRNTLAASLAANTKRDRFLAQARGYASSMEMHLDPNRVPLEIYDNLIEAVGGHLGLLGRYLALRKRALGLAELRMYDLYAPIAEEPGRRVGYEDACATVLEGLSQLGPRYLGDLRAALGAGWVDVHENRNKTRGAYSWGAYGTHPYVLMNFQGRLDDVLTLAHELGHSMHTFYTNQAQPFVYSEYKIFVAEVASTVNEGLVLDHLIASAKDAKEKAYLLNRKLEAFRGTLFRQTMFAEFEKEIHQLAGAGEALTPDALSQAYKRLNDKYYAAGVAVDEEIALEWARIPHFYHAFYVYQYATGISAATSLVARIAAEGAPAVERYMRFLASGGSDYPIELLRAAGVDLSTPAPVVDAMRAFEAALAELEALV
jgi:oligoendopeptidase F